MIDRRDTPRLALSLGAATTIVGSLCPWVASGRVDRSSYEIVELVERLGFAEDGPLGLAVRAWPLMPLLVVTGTVAMWWRRRALGSVLALVGAAHALAVALAVRTSTSGLLRVRVGPTLTIAGATILVAATVVAVVLTDRATRPVQ